MARYALIKTNTLSSPAKDGQTQFDTIKTLLKAFISHANTFVLYFTFLISSSSVLISLAKLQYASNELHLNNKLQWYLN